LPQIGHPDSAYSACSTADATSTADAADATKWHHTRSFEWHHSNDASYECHHSTADHSTADARPHGWCSKYR
jgi:hypothetical protein